MIRFQRNYLLLIGVAFTCSLIFQDYVEGKPWGEIDRRKRIIAQIGPGLNFGRLTSIDNNDIDRRKRQNGGIYPVLTLPFTDDSNDEDDYDLDRDARSASYGNFKTTYPPFPGDEDDYDRYLTGEPERTTWRTPTTTEKETNYNNNSNEIGSENKDESQSWRKYVPWFKRQWGRTKDFFKDQYNAASNHLG